MTESIPGYDKWKLQAPPEEIIKIEGGVKYTVIFRSEDDYCGQIRTLVHMKQCETLENEGLHSMLKRYKILNNIEFILLGHPEIVEEF